uniref:Protein kinase domain-containing protein n=1 Tax=Brassica campestris TaxID=3711 RepID=M4EI41_BRACM
MTHHKFPMLDTCQYSDGFLASVDSYMNLQIGNTEEYIKGQLIGNLREILIRPNQRRKREKYATEEPHKPRLIHHNSIKTHEKKTKEKRNPRRRPRMGPQRTRFVEKEPIFFFFRLSKANKLNHKWLYNKGVVVAIVLTMSAIVMLILLATYVIIVKVSKKKQEQRNLGLVSRRFKNSKTKFKYETLEKATDYFSTKKKLGEGGNGTVFLGILPNGKSVAVKRLVFNTREWVEEFFNEVNLISGIQHKNLVKLLGCSIEGPESLLVYEYVPNKSLDNFLFDESKIKSLNWNQRLNIILGTAEGLAYLHGSPVRIIHRDIKTSNVLLDDQLNPKVADFGLARCLGTDKTHLSTGIAGTLGYMAPEYVVRGQLTEKADVYSYGVLVLEIACGTRNNVFVPGAGHLLHRVWNLYRLNRLVEALDPCLNDEKLLQVQGSQAEVCKVLSVGLLCAQASPSLRPSMEEVISMLTERDYPIPSPTNPPFLRISSLATEGSSTASCSSNSTTMVKTDLASYTSSESFATRLVS